MTKRSTSVRCEKTPPSFKYIADVTNICVGSLVAVYLPKYPEFPQIGKVQSYNETEITISWFDGTFSDIWNEVKLKGEKKWCEKVQRSEILLCDIEFTKGQRLKKDCVQALREIYGHITEKTENQ